MTTPAPAKRPKYEFDVMRTGPGTLAGQYLRRHWQPVRISSALGKGTVVPLRIMGEDFTLYRGESGAPHVVDYRCAHRGTQLTTGRVEGDEIRCLYHGWKFAGNGQCTEQANEHRGFADKVKIKSYPTQDYLGLIFVYFGPEPVPPMPRFPQLDGPGYLDQSFYIRECNYFQNMENSMDETHANFTHAVSSFSDPGSINREVPVISADETPYGMVEYATRSDGTVRTTHFIMPNGVLMQLPLGTGYMAEGQTRRPFSDYIAWRVPIDDHVHLSCAAQRLDIDEASAERYFRHKEELMRKIEALPPAMEVTQKILRGELTLDDVADRADLVNIQDHVTQIGQGVFADRESEMLGRADIAVVTLRKIWQRELRQLAANGAVTDWKIPERIEVVSGVAAQ
jgi:5,5'-dehydrodivanillate O-demethylase oxygenase subunit